MEAILRSHSIYYVVNPKDKREQDKRTLREIVAGTDVQKQAQLRLELLKAENKVMALLETSLASDLLSKIQGKTPAQAWEALKPLHLANVSLHGWQEMQQLRAKDYEGVVN